MFSTRHDKSLKLCWPQSRSIHQLQLHEVPWYPIGACCSSYSHPLLCRTVKRFGRCQLQVLIAQTLAPYFGLPLSIKPGHLAFCRRRIKEAAQQRPAVLQASLTRFDRYERTTAVKYTNTAIYTTRAASPRQSRASEQTGYKFNQTLSHPCQDRSHLVLSPKLPRCSVRKQPEELGWPKNTVFDYSKSKARSTRTTKAHNFDKVPCTRRFPPSTGISTPFLDEVSEEREI